MSRDKFINKLTKQKKNIAYEGTKKVKDFESFQQQTKKMTKSQLEQELYKKATAIDNVQKDIDKLKTGIQKLARDSSEVIKRLKKENEELVCLNMDYTITLQYYADGEHFRETIVGLKLLDRGEKAKEVLECEDNEE